MAFTAWFPLNKLKWNLYVVCALKITISTVNTQF